MLEEIERRLNLGNARHPLIPDLFLLICSLKALELKYAVV